VIPPPLTSLPIATGSALPPAWKPGVDLADRDEAGGLVGDLDADGRLAGDRGLDAKWRRGEGEGEVVLEGRDLPDRDSFGGLDLVLRDRGPRVDADDLRGDVEARQRVLDHPDVAPDLVRHPLFPGRGRVEEVQRRQLPVDLGLVVLGLGDDAHHGATLVGLGLGLGFGDSRRRLLGELFAVEVDEEHRLLGRCRRR
jgi:hypothetical protein